MSETQNKFQIKGKLAEQFLHTLATKSFFSDWCFLNPILPDGKELCDLLVIFDNVAIIWQAKDLMLNKKGKYNPKEVKKNIRQLSGARRQLFDLKTPIVLENMRRTKISFDPDSISEIYLISALLGEGEDSYEIMESIKEFQVHVFTRKFTEIALKELDTISDFVYYLRNKEAFIKEKVGSLIVLGGEEEILAYYLLNNNSFDSLNGYKFVTLDGNHWKYLIDNPSYISKKKADKISYGWDSIIDRAHEGSSKYELVARELARPNRFARRVLGKAFFDANVIAHEDQEHDIYRRVVIGTDDKGNGHTYCFLFMDKDRPREDRAKYLEALCFVARGKYQKNSKVIGVATEQKIESKCSYDFILLEIPEWTDELEEQKNEFQKTFDILVDPKITSIRATQYPIVKKNTSSKTN
ncbi:MAG: hypothetical protein ACNFW9_02120 [Candidatus Kerfeldbacteria bacterium]